MPKARPNSIPTRFPPGSAPCSRAVLPGIPASGGLTTRRRLHRFHPMPTRSVDTTQSNTAEREEYRPPYGAPYVWILAAIDDPQPGGLHRLCQYETLIGRGEGAQIDLNDEQVSK